MPLHMLAAPLRARQGHYLLGCLGLDGRVGARASPATGGDSPGAGSPDGPAVPRWQPVQWGLPPSEALDFGPGAPRAPMPPSSKRP